MIRQEGRFPKFVAELEQVSYNGAYAAELGQNVLFVTERAVFARRPEGLTLIEIAPGIDVERDVLAHMGFTPLIAPDLKIMDARLFSPDPMDYAPDLLAKPRLNLPKRLRDGGSDLKLDIRY